MGGGGEGHSFGAEGSVEFSWLLACSARARALRLVITVETHSWNFENFEPDFATEH